jgi:hypothetical protein
MLPWMPTLSERARRIAPRPRAVLAIPALLAALAPGVFAPAAVGAPGGGWSQPSPLAECTTGGRPQVAFPSDAPTSPTGPGAVVWLQPRGGCGEGRGLSLAVGRFDAYDRVAAVSEQALPASPALAGASGTSLGRIAVAVPAGSPTPALRQGRAGRHLAAVRTIEAAPGQVALARAYLGDLAVAVVEPDHTIALYVERHYRPRFDPPVRIPIASGQVTALTATMDYRADVLLAWQQEGSVWAHMLRQSRRPDPTQRVGPSEPDPQLTAVVSDNDHGMIAWSSSSAGRTSVRLALSAAGVSFGSIRTLASFADPQGLAAGAGSLALVRLSTENVLLAWTAPAAGRISVLAAPAVYAGVRRPLRLEAPGEAALSGLAAGPAADVVAVYRSVSGAGGGVTLMASRISIGHHDRVRARPAEPIAAAAGLGVPAVAVDPATDRPVAVWTAGGALEYATGTGLAGYAAHPVPEPPLSGSSVHWLRVAGAVALGLGLLAAGGWLLARRRRPRGRVAP